MIKNNNIKFDVEKRQNSLFNAAKDNAIIVNNTVQLLQNSILVIGIANLALLITILLNHQFLCDFQINFIKISTIFLFIGFILFIVAVKIQHTYILRIARFYEKQSNNAIKNYLNNGIQVLDKEPGDLKLKTQQIQSNKLANYIFILSYVFIILPVFASIYAIIFLL